MKITNPITLDVARSNSYICLLAKQFDSNSRYLEITLADNGQPLTIPADASAVLRATRADGTGAVVSGTVANGKATVEIDDYILEVNGAVTLSLEISKDGEILTTPSCNLTIQKADASGWIRVYVADANKVAGNYYITIGGVSYSFTTSQAIPAGGSVYFSSNNATAETRNATGTVIETGLVLTEGTTGTQLVTDVPTMSFLATIAGRVAALESEMPNKADKDGIIALAENLTPYSSTSGATQSVPFINQGTGTGNGESVVDTGSYAQVKKKLGNTVCVNQLVPDFTSENAVYFYYPASLSHSVSDGVISTIPNGNYSSTLHYGLGMPASFAFIPGRTYICWVSVRSTKTDKFRLRLGTQFTYSDTVSANTWTTIKTIFTAGSDNTATVYAYDDTLYTTSDRIDFKAWYISDLTLWFGSNDRIPSDLLSHPENWGRYYAGSLAYNAGTLDSADGSVLTSIGRNCWDGENDVTAIPNQAYYCKGTATITYKDRSGNTISTASVTDTSFTTPADCFSFGVSGTGVTISLYYSGESGYDSDYPYTVLAEVDTGSEVLRSAGSVADDKTPDGTIMRRVGFVDLGTLNWNAMTYGGHVLFYASNATQAQNTINYACAKYPCVGDTIAGLADKNSTGYGGAGTNIWVRDDSYNGDTAAFKAGNASVYLYYELATPTTEQGTAFAENIPCDDFGSLMWTQTKGIPQGNEIFYPVDYKASLDTLLNRVEGDVGKIVTDDTYPDAPSSNGTYVLKVTVSDGTPTYSWVAE